MGGGGRKDARHPLRRWAASWHEAPQWMSVGEGGRRAGAVSPGRAVGRVTPEEGSLVVGDYVNEGVDGRIAEFNSTHFLVGVYHD